VTRLELQVPIALNGCKRCANRAQKAGTDCVVDIDQDPVDRTTWTPFKDR